MQPANRARDPQRGAGGHCHRGAVIGVPAEALRLNIAYPQWLHGRLVGLRRRHYPQVGPRRPLAERVAARISMARADGVVRPMFEAHPPRQRTLEDPTLERCLVQRVRGHHGPPHPRMAAQIPNAEFGRRMPIVRVLVNKRRRLQRDEDRGKPTAQKDGCRLDQDGRLGRGVAAGRGREDGRRLRRWRRQGHSRRRAGGRQRGAVGLLKRQVGIVIQDASLMEDERSDLQVLGVDQPSRPHASRRHAVADVLEEVDRRRIALVQLGSRERRGGAPFDVIPMADGAVHGVHPPPHLDGRFNRRLSRGVRGCVHRRDWRGLGRRLRGDLRGRHRRWRFGAPVVHRQHDHERRKRNSRGRDPRPGAGRHAAIQFNHSMSARPPA